MIKSNPFPSSPFHDLMNALLPDLAMEMAEYNNDNEVWVRSSNGEKSVYIQHAAYYNNDDCNYIVRIGNIKIRTDPSSLRPVVYLLLCERVL